ncbi:unnamed protein product [Knipowitschia caucasica]
MGIILDHFVDGSCGQRPCNYRAPDDDDSGPFPGVQDSQEVCTTSFSTSPPSQCVCTLSPSPSKLSKPLPLDSLPLPLGPGLVTHNNMYSSRLCYQPQPGPEPHHTAANNQVHAGKEGGVVLMPTQTQEALTAAQHHTYSSGVEERLNHRSASPSDPVESLSNFTRKVGAFLLVLCLCGSVTSQIKKREL